MDCDTCWLPGGYPELHAGRIASNRRFMDGLRAFAADRPVHGECGGYMVLGRMIEDADGTRHAMTGLLPIETSLARRKLTLGYRAASIRGSVSFARPHQKLYGHEFHHATVTASEGEAFADVTTAEGLSLPPAGHRLGTVTGSFFHLIA
jgi:cobyrinic acid a,c-diamide synthase